ncbi:DUF2332 domain-containing protein [Methylosinus sporium]|uniref:DUF2332 domain-containing protein n=1 Tax=Methylosinus sporium TaxID=428 RepID=A0A2U1SN29_METSR|nr:DUF2332 family protein [Methylosinus sporium]PWB93006.1 DUF2332 domain-containing protein [Methylosinus sporium]
MTKRHSRLPDEIADAFDFQAKACRDLASPFTAALCETLAARLDERSAFGRRISSWGPRAKADALALRACGALHFLARSGKAPELAAAYPPDALDEARLAREIARAIEAHDDFLAGFLDRPPQTNETGRSSVILGGALIVAAATGLPLETFEIGASAGLNLHFDRYAYDLGVGAFGDPSAPLRLACDWRGAAPSLDAPLQIVSHAGCDVDPLDPGEAEHRARLLAYVWPDQSERLARMETALACAAARPERVERADAGDWLAARLAAPPTRNVARFVYHTVVWQYLPLETKRRATAALEAAGATTSRETPLARLQMEADGDTRSAALTLTLWPGGESLALGRADFHGRWAEWSGVVPHRLA